MAKKKTGGSLGLLLDQVKTDQTEVIGAVHRHLVQQEREKPPYIPLGYHPSQLSLDTCARALVLERIGVLNEDIHAARTLRIFQVGTNLHRDWGRYLVQAGVLKPWQVEVPIHKVRKTLPDDVCDDLGITRKRRVPKVWQDAMKEVMERTMQYGLRGHVDGVLDDGSILEIKSIKSGGFNAYPMTNRPLPRHLIQTSLYAWAMDAPRIVFLYECKDTQTPREVVVKPDKRAVKVVFKLISSSIGAIDMRKLPPKHSDCPRRGSAKANKCPFAAACFSGKSFEELDSSETITPRDYR